MRGKARYNAPKTFSELVKAQDPIPPDRFGPDAQSQIEQVLSGITPKLHKADIDEIVAEIISVGRSISTGVVAIAEELKKKDIIAEIDDLQASLRKATPKLRGVSPSLTRLLPQAADLLEVADRHDLLIDQLNVTRDQVVASKLQRLRPNEMKRHFAGELAFRVIEIFKVRGLKANASADPASLEASSDLVKVLGSVGAASGLQYQWSTWRNIAATAKASGENAPQALDGSQS